MMVVPLADARSEPHTVMVVPEHAIVADMAVGRPRRPEYLTSLTIFEFIQLI